MIRRIKFIGLMLLVFVLVSSCGGRQGKPEYFVFPYDGFDHSISISGKSSVISVIQLSHSRDTDAVIFSKVDDNGEVELYEMNTDDSNPRQITNNETIEFYPAIGNSGKVTYSIHAYNVWVTKLHYENIALNLPAGFDLSSVFRLPRGVFRATSFSVVDL